MQLGFWAEIVTGKSYYRRLTLPARIYLPTRLLEHFRALGSRTYGAKSPHIESTWSAINSPEG